MPSRMIPRNAQSQNPQVNAEDFPQSPFQRKEILEPDRPPTQSADIASPAPSNPGYSSMPLPIASHHSSPLISATVRSQFSPPNTHSPAITEKENFPVQRTQYPECGYPSASPEKFITFEPEIVRVKTRGTSPFSSTDFEKIFPESFDSSNSQPNPVNSASKPQQSPKDLSPGYGSFPQSGSSLNGIETATLKILESQTKAQEVHGDMIGKFTNLVAELGKIITHREMSSSVPNSGKKIKKKKMSSESPSQDSPPIRHMAPITSTNTIATVGKTALERKSPRSRRDDVLDLILQRLQVIDCLSSLRLLLGLGNAGVFHIRKFKFHYSRLSDTSGS